MLKKISLSFLNIFMLTALCANAQQSLPVANLAEITPLTEIANDPLQVLLEDEVMKNPTWRRLIKNKKMSIGIVDLNDVNNAHYAGVNSNEMMYAASLPKIAILLASMDAIEKCELVETPEVTRDLNLMINRSDNHASTRMIDRLGYDKIASVLKSPEYKLYDELNGGGLWVGKRYAAGGARNPDPIKGLSHAATVQQVCRFYYKMITGNLVSPEKSKNMLDIMEDSHLHHKFVNTLDRIAPNARVFRKSGSWRNYHADSALVWGKDGRKYIVVALIEDPNGEQIIRDLIVPVENIIKKSRSLETT
ncbi:serine hydrolase [Mesonia aestuariivivens]|uniref:beta-lactamase n=1 Tax=Mesonia aestuariivivens TaxID=2796128 RepID=A0ABS6VZ16_9FLAO|nr:serine hydrolase [Mesonia aestuariivivens]MBW2960527.1 class A beta-lactamase-related serine hydrolase [Mesonia aestuariivivens]